MIRIIVTQEYLEELYRSGYHFREKIVKGISYLSARKGGKEIGLGPYTQELREMVAVVTEPKQDRGEANSKTNETTYTVRLGPQFEESTPAKAEFSRREVEAALFDIKFERARIKAADCEHSWVGFCHYWEFLTDRERIVSIYERFGVKDNLFGLTSIRPQGEGQPRKTLLVNELLCFDCEKYAPRKK